MAKRGTRGGKKVKERQAADAIKKDLTKATDMNIGNGFGNGWSAATPSEKRGYVWWPNLDTSKELPPHTRLEILRKARWADAEVGLVRRAVSGLADLVGYQRPQAETGDPEWDQLAEEAVLRRWNNPIAFDQAGKMDAWSWQVALTRCRFRDGDNLTALGSTQSGGATMQFYESHQIDSGDKTTSNLYDGVFLGKGGKHDAYQIVGSNLKGERTHKKLSARDVIYHAEFERPGRVREPSKLAHAISNIVDIIEILADTKHGIKIAAQLGVVMTTQAGAGNSQMSETLASFLSNQGVGTNSSGDDVEINLDEIMKGGRSQSLPAGADMKTLQDTRPHPNQLDLLRWLVRDIAWGAGVAPEILWEQAGLGSAATRYLMAETRRWIENQQRVQRYACQRMWTYTLAKEIKAGRVPTPTSERWWSCKWIPQADMTIDRGRDGALEIQQIEKGLLTYQESYAKRGKDWQEEMRQLAKEKALMAELGLSGQDLQKNENL